MIYGAIKCAMCTNEKWLSKLTVSQSIIIHFLCFKHKIFQSGITQELTFMWVDIEVVALAGDGNICRCRHDNDCFHKQQQSHFFFQCCSKNGATK